MANPISTLINHASERRTTKRHSGLLEREFAAFTTPVERTELEAILGRYPDEQTQEMRELLGRQATRLF